MSFSCRDCGHFDEARPVPPPNPQGVYGKNATRCGYYEVCKAEKPLSQTPRLFIPKVEA